MSQPWSPERVISELEAIELIEEQFPQLKPATLKVLGEGFDNTVFLVNELYVFRFPRKALAAGLIQTENRLLPVIESALPIPVPNPQFQGQPSGEYPWPFGGYKMLPGKTPARLTKEQRMLSVEPLAHFLRTLHDFPVPKAEKLQVPPDQIERMNILKRKPMLESNIKKAWEKRLISESIKKLLHSFLLTIEQPLNDDTRTLVHGDLHIRNMLVDDAGQISAVIDWGDTHIGHPAVDLSIVYSFLPAEGRDLFFRLYGDVPPEVKKVARFKAVYSLLVLLLYGEDLKDKDLVEESRSTLLLALED